MVGLSLTKLLLEEGYNVVHVSRSKDAFPLLQNTEPAIEISIPLL